MEDFEKYSLAISGLSSLFTLIGLVWVALQLKTAKVQLQLSAEQQRLASEQMVLSVKAQKAQYDWNRRLAAQNALNDYNQADIGSKIRKKFDYLNSKETIPLSEIEKEFLEDADLQSDLHKLLNSYEALARGVFQGIYDIEVIEVGRRNAILNLYRAFSNYIDNRREKFSSKAWAELDVLVSEWKKIGKEASLRRAVEHEI